VSNLAPITTWSGPGACLEGLRRAEGKPRQPGWIGKQDETEQTVYRKNQTRPNNLYSLRALQAPNTGAPLPRGDALVAYENVKCEKNCLGKETGSEKNLEMNELRV